jgi:DNA-binding transcriptional regulator YdaS (Cro superfamily)
MRKKKAAVSAAQLAATNEVIKTLGGITKAAAHFDITIPAVQLWRTRGVPKDRVKAIEAATGVKRARLLPKLYG